MALWLKPAELGKTRKKDPNPASEGATKHGCYSPTPGVNSTQPTGLGNLCPQGMFISHLRLRAQISPSPMQDMSLELFLSLLAAELQG